MLEGEAYAEVDRSRHLPDAPLAAFARHLAGPDQARAVFDFLDWLRGPGGPAGSTP